MKKKKSQWLKKPTKPGWYWIQVETASIPWAVGYWGRFKDEFDLGPTLVPLNCLWNYEFHPVEPPK